MIIVYVINGGHLTQNALWCDDMASGMGMEPASDTTRHDREGEFMLSVSLASHYIMEVR